MPHAQNDQEIDVRLPNYHEDSEVVDADGFVVQKYWTLPGSTYVRVQKAKFLPGEEEPFIIVDVMPEEDSIQLTKAEYETHVESQKQAYAQAQVDNGGAANADFFEGKLSDDMMLMLFGRAAS